MGISCNAKPAQTAFASSLGSIPYPILSDFYPHGKVCSDYGVLNEQTGVPVRAIIIVDKEGLVRFSKIYKAASDLNPSDILSEVAKL